MEYKLFYQIYPHIILSLPTEGLTDNEQPKLLAVESCNLACRFLG